MSPETFDYGIALLVRINITFFLFSYRKRNWGLGIVTWERKDRQEEHNWDTDSRQDEKPLSDSVLSLSVTLSSCFKFLLLQYM